MNWFKVEGEEVGKIIHEKLREKGFLSFNDIIDIIDDYRNTTDNPIFRKTEHFIFKYVHAQEDVERCTDEKGRMALKLVKSV